MECDMEQAEAYKLIEDHYREFGQKKFHLLAGKAGSRYNAEDVVQEAYCRALKYWKHFDPKKGTITKWINRIVNNALMDNFKAERGRGMIVQSLKEENMISADVSFAASRAVATIELKEVLAKMDAKPDSVKEILYLNLIEGYTAREVAEIVPENVVQIWNIVRDFRKELKGAEDYIKPATGTV
jgi:RNA polymerase sigma factor (sigma-70 family)